MQLVLYDATDVKCMSVYELASANTDLIHVRLRMYVATLVAVEMYGGGDILTLSRSWICNLNPLSLWRSGTHCGREGEQNPKFRLYK